MVGIIHPCKIYGAMAVARPILFLGPQPLPHQPTFSTSTTSASRSPTATSPRAIAAIHRLRQLPAAERSTMGQTAAKVLNETLSQSLLCGQFCDAVAKAMRIE